MRTTLENFPKGPRNGTIYLDKCEKEKKIASFVACFITFYKCQITFFHLIIY